MMYVCVCVLGTSAKLLKATVVRPNSSAFAEHISVESHTRKFRKICSENSRLIKVGPRYVTLYLKTSVDVYHGEKVICKSRRGNRDAFRDKYLFFSKIMALGVITRSKMCGRKVMRLIFL